MDQLREPGPADAGAGDARDQMAPAPERPPVGSLRSYLVRVASLGVLVVIFLATDALVARPQIQTASGALPFTLQGYLHVDPTDVVFVYLGSSGTTISGTLTGAYLDSSLPHQLKRASDTLSGTINGSRIAFSLDGTSDPGRDWSGTLSGNRLVVSYPTPQGTSTRLEFTDATVGAFDRAVTNLQDRVGAD